MSRFQDLSQVLKSATDPFSLLALMTVVLGLVAYSAIQHSPKLKAGFIPAPLIALSIVAISFLAFTFNVFRIGNSQENLKLHSSPIGLQLQVTFKSYVQHKTPITVPFSINSSQINVGCGDAASVSVSWNLPAGAREVNASPLWTAADGLRSVTANVVVQGSTVVATGQASGRDREWTGNCPSGGHGELLLKGTYVIDRLSSDEGVSFPAFLGTILPGGTTAIDIPTADGLTGLLCEVTLTNVQGQQSHFSISIELSSDTKLARIVSPAGTDRLTARVIGNALLLKIEPS